MEETKKMVSVLIPCFNHEKFVTDCFKSIVNQTYSNYEVIICDDASSDRSVEVIQEQKKMFDEKNIRFLFLQNESNMGLTKTVNRLLREARGEYVKIIASDDMFKENYMSEMTELLDKDDSLKFVFSNCICVKEETTYPVSRENEIGPLLEYIPDYKNGVFEKIYLNNFIPAPSIMFRRSVLLEMGGYDESIGIEDLEMSLRILQKYPQGLGSPEKELIYYRATSNSMSSLQYNESLLKRARFMYVNSKAIAKKYRKQVPGSLYRKRMFRLLYSYLLIWKGCKLHH